MAQSQTVRLEWDTRSLRKVADKLGRSEKAFRVELGAMFLEVIRSHIRSRTGTLARSWKVFPRGYTLVYSSRTPYSYASVKGNFVRPTRRRALAFEVGGEKVFARVVRYGPGAYLGRPKGSGSSKSYLDAAAEDFPRAAKTAFKVAFGPL